MYPYSMLNKKPTGTNSTPTVSFLALPTCRTSFHLLASMITTKFKNLNATLITIFSFLESHLPFAFSLILPILSLFFHCNPWCTGDNLTLFGENWLKIIYYKHTQGSFNWYKTKNISITEKI